jgi:kumamolisin
MFAPRLATGSAPALDPHVITPSAYFTAAQLRSIYQIPAPTPSSYTVAVLSFGGGLYGSVDSQGVLTGGDVQAYWTSLGIPANAQPKVVIVPLSGATNNPSMSDSGATMENTIDVETIGGIYPSSALTIILYIAPNSLAQFPVILQAALAGGAQTVSCSWGAPEIYFSRPLLASIDTIMASMVAAGITMCVATGDSGSSDGVAGGNHVDFPSSHPNCLAVGGTTLVCPNRVWDAQTSETGWSAGGGGISTLYPRPAYQAAVSTSGRGTPDLAAVADPATGVIFTIHGTSQVVGGTSVAAPILAGFLAAIGCRRFVTPLLYGFTPSQIAGCFHDLTGGSNGGYSAQAGYDHSTGWGSIQGTALAAALAPPALSSITLFPGMVSLVAGQSTTIQVTLTPSTASATLAWTSSVPSVAAISASGLVTALAAGTTVIVAQAQGVAAQATIVVTPAPLVATSLLLAPLTATMHPGATLTLTATVQPVGVPVTWSVNSSVVTLAGQQITATAVGAATVTVRAGALSASAAITVVQPVTSIMITPSTFSLLVGATRTLSALVSPSTAPNKALTWTSSAPSVATLSASGIVTALAAGTATLQATSQDSPAIMAQAIVTVSAPINLQITVSSQLNRGVQAQAQTTAPSTVWQSMLPSVATISATGLITAVANGLTVITAQAQGRTVSAMLRVTTAATGILLNRGALTIPHGSTAVLQAAVQPAAATNQGVLWASSRPLIATVQGGVVRGNIAGQVTVTAQAVDGGWTATCIVTVT